jgi:lipopolysaccharide transport system permease protein
MDTAVTTAPRPARLELRGDPGFSMRNRLALRDLSEGSRLLPLAWTLGWLDIRLRYRGSTLGPLWLTLSTGVMVASLGYLYAGIFHTSVGEYLPYLALSIVLWGFLSSVVSESCTSFTDSEGIVRSVRMPFFLFSIRLLIRNALVLGHNILVIAVVFVIFHAWPGWYALLALPGLVLWAFNCLTVSLLLGTFCARFRDILPIVGSVMQILFFITPVFWKPEQLGPRANIVLPFNPAFDMLEVVRQPLLGVVPGPRIWLGAVVYSAILLIMAWGLFSRARGRIAFWI